MNLPLFIILALVTSEVELKITGDRQFEPLAEKSFFGTEGIKRKPLKDTHFKLHNSILKSKVEVLGEQLKIHVTGLHSNNKQLELVFLVDSSASVGAENFKNELKFVKKLLAGFTVAANATRVAVIAYSSPDLVVRHVDHISTLSHSKHKCSLLHQELPAIEYTGGGTYTLGALLEAQAVLQERHPGSQQALFLITDGFSNGGDPLPAAQKLREQGVTIFTFGIQNGNTKELQEIASQPGEEYAFILDSFSDFEAMVRRAFHQDLKVGSYQPLNNASLCDSLCESHTDCCDSLAICSCGTHSGHFACVCPPGYYGSGLKGACTLCPNGTYSAGMVPGDVMLCTPCPDPNHITMGPASSSKECVCKKGFAVTAGNKCRVITCPKLTAPEKGYFVKKHCGNVLNAACGIRCQVGYQLTGSSIRLCQENGTWSGQEAECIVKTCPPPEVAESVSMECSGGSNYVIDTVCKFSCQPGHILVGSRHRNCLPLARWDGLHTSCKPIFCPPLPSVTYGNITPTTCTVGKQPYGTRCKILCQEGFQLKGPKERVCGGNAGTWSGRNSSSRCVDVTPPEITCPENIVVNTNEGENFATVSWAMPITTDNSGETVTVWSKPASQQSMKIEIGTITFTYVAVDANNNKAYCNFTVTVEDREPPRVDHCESPLPFLLDRGDTIPLSWDPPLFSDNSGQQVKVQQFPDQDIFPYGTTEVTYLASDVYGNNSTCIINITVEENVCSQPVDPVHGHANCTSSTNALHCTLTCDEGYAFAVQPRDYFCTYDSDGTVLAPDPVIDPFPDCSVTVLPKYVTQDASLTIDEDGTLCEDPVFLSQLEEEIRQKIVDGLAEICGNELTCSMQNVMACDSVLSALEEESNLVSRQRRQTVSARVPSGVHMRRGKNDSLHLHHPAAVYQRRERKGRNKKLQVHFLVTGHTKNNKTRPQVLVSAMRRMKDAGISVHGVKVEFHGEPQLGCSRGSVLQGGVCVLCPVGTYYNITTRNCESCPIGSYQPKEGSLVCLVCPPGTSTRRLHAKNARDCKALCPPGCFGRKRKPLRSSIPGVMPCTTCDYGSYQPKPGQTDCNRCPGNWTTLKRGSAHLQDCRAPCPPGEISRSGFSPCLPCPEGYLQPFSGQKFCENALQNEIKLWADECLSQPCINGGTCHILDTSSMFSCECPLGFMGALCELPVIACNSNPCLNGGSCIDIQPGNYLCLCASGFSGINCEMDINECDLQPCKNGATCVDSLNSVVCLCPDGFTGPDCTANINECAANPCSSNAVCIDSIANYSCECTGGFSGRYCEIEPQDPCLEEPCHNGGTCITTENNATLLDYSCTCSLGYSGRHCEQDIDDCASNPCKNNGSCIDLVSEFKCHCAPLFTGILCETELPSEYFLKFPTSGTTDYVRMRGPGAPLTQVSVCLWLKSTDRFNYGTVFSYATNESDNSFTLTDYNGFVLYINGERIVTDVTANDGSWHSICVTWNSTYGEWRMYVDGNVGDSGSGLARGEQIPGNGILILGQEQDSLGSGFNEAESFTGYLSSVAMWDYVLQATEVWNLAALCSQLRSPVTPTLGNIFMWSDFLSGIHGNLKIEKSSFCTDCITPAPPFQGNVTVTGSTAIYMCNTGFVLHWGGKEIASTKLERKCLKQGDWEGPTPYCIRRTCGFPGYFPHGTIQGRSYRYSDQIKYSCNPGYQLIGNAIRVCQETGKWSGSIPKCQGTPCEALNPPEHGQLHLLWDNEEVLPQYGHQVEVECNPGFILDTSSSALRILTCLEDGQWDDVVPTCKSIGCLNPPILHHARISNISISANITGNSVKSNDVPEVNVYNFGTRLIYSCDPGYRPLTNMQHLSVTCDNDGQWTRMSKGCVLIECPSVSIKHAIINGLEKKIFTSGTELHVQCEFGYQLMGPEHLKCSDNGTWIPSENSTSCQLITCPYVNIANGVMGTTNTTIYSVESEAVIHCDKGFRLVGPKIWKCTQNGTWSPQSMDTECQLIMCNLSVLKVKHGTLQPKNKTKDGLYLPRAEVEVICREGYHRLASSNIFCQENGTWTVNTVECHLITCNAHSALIEHGSVEESQRTEVYAFGTELNITCEEGYKLVGPNIRRCQSNGTWSLSGHCQRINCSILHLPLSDANTQNGQLVINGTSYGDTVNFTCNQQSKIAGDVDRLSWKCDGNGKWQLIEGTTVSLEGPLCKTAVLQCPEPKDPDNGYILREDSPNNLTIGSIIKLKCRLGYILQGANSKICLPNGSWSNGNATCAPVQCRSPPIPYHTEVPNLKQKFFYGNMVNHQCREGYEPYGDLTSRCQANGKWSRVRGKCTRISCGKPLTRGGATVIGESYLFQDQIKVVCPAGMEVSSALIIVCQSNGNWSDIADCKKI